MWLVGLLLLHLAFIFHRMRQSAAAQQLRERLRRKGAVPVLYTFTKFAQPCALYLKMKFPNLNTPGCVKMCRFVTSAPPTSLLPRGSTTEWPKAKLRQLQQLKLPKTEIAVRYWNDSQNCEHFSTVLLSPS